MGRAIGHWREMEYDDSLELDGLTWRRVRGGFGDGRTEREDWVLDLPGLSASVNRYRQELWRSHGSPMFETKEDAMRDEVRTQLRWLPMNLQEAVKGVEALSVAAAGLVASVDLQLESARKAVEEGCAN